MGYLNASLIAAISVVEKDLVKVPQAGSSQNV